MAACRPASAISAPLPRWLSTWATSHCEDPDCRARSSSSSPLTRPVRWSWFPRSALMVLSARVLMVLLRQVVPSGRPLRDRATFAAKLLCAARADHGLGLLSSMSASRLDPLSVALCPAAGGPGADPRLILVREGGQAKARGDSKMV